MKESRKIINLSSPSKTSPDIIIELLSEKTGYFLPSPILL
jgi:hypothetical protein